MIGPLDSIPDNPIDLFLDRQFPVIDLGRVKTGKDYVEPGESRVFGATVRLPSAPGNPRRAR